MVNDIPFIIRGCVCPNAWIWIESQEWFSQLFVLIWKNISCLFWFERQWQESSSADRDLQKWNRNSEWHFINHERMCVSKCMQESFKESAVCFDLEDISCLFWIFSTKTAYQLTVTCKSEITRHDKHLDIVTYQSDWKCQLFVLIWKTSAVCFDLEDISCLFCFWKWSETAHQLTVTCKSEITRHEKHLDRVTHQRDLKCQLFVLIWKISAVCFGFESEPRKLISWPWLAKVKS